ncbi:hypothetical protein MNBD_GAMMA26-1135 [hydrothermal vent metagenome]|uniref:Antitoxin n=1 Tax=hydrothermal vent metagenome TaxID=652676 RepID=A0A3B1B0L9_9ZZZZ
MNITLSADTELIKKGREYAKAHNTSLNQLIRDYLLRLTGECEAEKAADEFVHIASTMSGQSDSDFRFSRDAVYDRQAD